MEIVTDILNFAAILALIGFILSRFFGYKWLSIFYLKSLLIFSLLCFSLCIYKLIDKHERETTKKTETTNNIKVLKIRYLTEEGALDSIVIDMDSIRTYKKK